MDGFQLAEELRELLHLIALHLDEAANGLLTLTVMRKRMIATVQTERLSLKVTTDLQCGDAGGIGLQGEREKTEHSLL